MKLKIGLIVLATVCLGLIVALFTTRKAAVDQRVHDTAIILDFSNQLDTANLTLNDVRQVNLELTTKMTAVQQTAAEFSNDLAAASSALSASKASLQSAEGKISNLNGRIADLEAQNKALDERAADLTGKLADLNARILITQQKLANSEADNTFLAAELQKQLAQKTELERKFGDLNVVRAQVKKLRDDLYVARRLEWMANGTSPSTVRKGGELLMRRSTVSVAPASAKAAPAPLKPASPYDLNVEVGSDGSVRVISATNSPSH